MLDKFVGIGKLDLYRLIAITVSEFVTYLLKISCYTLKSRLVLVIGSGFK